MLERFKELERKLSALLDRIESQARRIEELEAERDDLLRKLEDGGIGSVDEKERNEQIRGRLKGLIERIDRVESEIVEGRESKPPKRGRK